MTLARKHELVDELVATYRVSIRTGCETLSMNRSSYYYKGHRDEQKALRMKIRDYATFRVKYGYRRIRVLLQREGLKVNKKRIYRLYRLENLNVRLKKEESRFQGRALNPSRRVGLTRYGRWISSQTSCSMASGSGS